jgi:hypothetical protein
MTDVIENGRSGGAWPLPPGESHDEFLELCALSTTGLLSVQERHRLEEHLLSCHTCRQLCAQYEALADAAIPSAIVDSGEEPGRRAASGWSVEDAEAALFARLDREEEQPTRIVTSRGVDASRATPEVDLTEIPGSPDSAVVDALWRQMWWQYAAAVLLVVALGVSLYRTGFIKGEKIAASPPPAHLIAPPAPEKVNSVKANPPADASPSLARAAGAEVSALRAQVESKTGEVAQLEEEKARLEQELLADRSDRDQLAQNAEQLKRELTAREADVATARGQLAANDNQTSQSTDRLSTLEQQIEDLKSSVGKKDQEIARQQELLDHDRDIRELMGSRKLYIAEVYDVAKNGETQRPFGRVFYTKGKSLVFYAYDLDQQSGIRETTTFQAWGRKGPDPTHAVNLGIFYADNAANKRWVLKSDDPKVLADIDAVFVTLEPHGGSSRPSGKPLLFAYLRVEPNHP